MARDKPLLIMITSTRSGTGKTLLALAMTLHCMERGASVLGIDLNFSNPDFSRMLLTLINNEAKRSPQVMEIPRIPYPTYLFSDDDALISVLALANPYYPLAPEEIWHLINTVISLERSPARAVNSSETINITNIPKDTEKNTARKLQGRKVYIIETNLNLTSLSMISNKEQMEAILETTELYIFHVWSLTPFLSKLRLEPILGRFRLSNLQDRGGNEKYLRGLAEEIKVLHGNLLEHDLTNRVVNIFTPKFYHIEKSWPTRIPDSKSVLTEEQESLLESLPISSKRIPLLALSEILEMVAFDLMKNDAAYLWGTEDIISELFGKLLSHFEQEGFIPSNVILIPQLRLNAHRLSDLMTVSTTFARVRAITNLKIILKEILTSLKLHFEVLLS